MGTTGLWTDQSFHKTSSFLSISLAPLLHVHGAQTYLRCHPLPETLQWAAYVEGVAKGASCPPKIHAPFHCMEMLDHGCPPRMTFSSSSGTEMGPCGYFSPMEHEWKWCSSPLQGEVFKKQVLPLYLLFSYLLAGRKDWDKEMVEPQSGNSWMALWNRAQHRQSRTQIYLS